MQNNTVTAHLSIQVNGIEKGIHMLPSPTQDRIITHEYQSTKDGGASMITSNLPKDLLHQLQHVFNQYFADAKVKEKSIDKQVSEHLEGLTAIRDKQLEFLDLQKEESKSGFLFKWIREVDELKAELQRIQNEHDMPSPGSIGSVLFQHSSASWALLKMQLEQIDKLFFTARHLIHKLRHSHVNIPSVYATIKDQWIFLSKVKALSAIVESIQSRKPKYWSHDVKSFKLFLTHKL